MSYLALLLLVFATWALVLAAAAQRNLVLARRTGRQASGVSIFPGIPVMPLGFFAAAWLLERVFPSIGLLLVGGLHVGIILFSLVSMAASRVSLR